MSAAGWFFSKKKKYCSEAERRYTMFATKLAALGRDDIIHGSGNANHLRTRSESPKKSDALEVSTTLAYGFCLFSGQFWRFFLLLKSWKRRIAVLAPQRCVCVLFPDQEKKIPFWKCLSTRPRHTSIFGCQCFSRFHCTIRSWSGKFTGASWFEDLVAGPLMPHVKILFITMWFNHHPPKTTTKKSDSAFFQFSLSNRGSFRRIHTFACTIRTT